jgi:hypothetical protein
VWAARPQPPDFLILPQAFLTASFSPPFLILSIPVPKFIQSPG